MMPCCALPRPRDRGSRDSSFCALSPSISRVLWSAQERGMTSAGSDSDGDRAPLVKQ